MEYNSVKVRTILIKVITTMFMIFCSDLLSLTEIRRICAEFCRIVYTVLGKLSWEIEKT